MRASKSPIFVLVSITVECPFPKTISVLLVFSDLHPWALAVDCRSNMASAPVSSRACLISDVAADTVRGSSSQSHWSRSSPEGAERTSSVD